jgi:hypothetical protein
MGTGENKHCINMKKLFLLLTVTLLFVGCEKEEKVNTNADLEFYKITEKDGLEIKSSFFAGENTDMVLLSGIKNGDAWIGLFDNTTGNEVHIWTGDGGRYYFDVGFLTSDNGPRPDFSFVLTFNWGYAFSGELKQINGTDTKQGVVILNKETSEIIIVDGPYSVYVPLGEYMYGQTYDGDRIIISSKGDVIDSVIGERVYSDGREIFFYTGFREGRKPWVALLNSDMELIEEWTGDNALEKNRKIDLGYGEYRNFTIDYFSIPSFLKTEYGYALLPRYMTYDDYYRDCSGDLFLLNEGNVFIYTSELGRNSISEIYNWYNGSVVFRDGDNYSIISPEGKTLGTLTNFHSGFALSYTEVIVPSLREVYRYDCEKNEWLWSVNFSDYITIQSDARVTPTITDKDANTIIYELDIVNRDGSRQNFKCEININTGSVRVL